MVLSPLITAADLANKADVSDLNLASDIAAASAAIRAHAGPITSGTATIKIEGTRERWLPLPVSPVTAVSAVTVDGGAVGDWRFIEGRLWRACGWQSDCGPSEVAVTLTYGLAAVPADIIDLACSLVVGAQHERAEGPRRGVAYERIDDHQVGYIQDPAAERLSAFELPERTKAMLHDRFGGGGAYVTGSVR